eukprot:3417507-Amphidinium_carterae.1
MTVPDHGLTLNESLVDSIHSLQLCRVAACVSITPFVYCFAPKRIHQALFGHDDVPMRRRRRVWSLLTMSSSAAVLANRLLSRSLRPNMSCACQTKARI